MDFQLKLDNLHSEIISALCSIREFLEGLLPHSVFVEEETEESFENGHSIYKLYNLTEIFANGTCLLENPGTGIEEKRTLKEICIDHLAELWNTYRYLSGDEVGSNVTGLLQSMEHIAKSLISGRYITDFTVHDTNFICKSNAKIPFIWLVYKSGTHLYFTVGKQEILNLKNRLDYYENYSESDFFLYRYDGQNLSPVFPKIIHEWIDKQLTIDK